MKQMLYLSSAFFVCVGIMVVVFSATVSFSAIHEIEGALLVLVGAVLVVGAAIVGAIGKQTDELKNALVVTGTHKRKEKEGGWSQVA